VCLNEESGMKDALKKFPWFEVILIVGLAFALIVKPQTSVLSATPEAVRTTSATNPLLPSVTASTQPDVGQ
jgi:hypothetical protein